MKKKLTPMPAPSAYPKNMPTPLVLQLAMQLMSTQRQTNKSVSAFPTAVNEILNAEKIVEAQR